MSDTEAFPVLLEAFPGTGAFKADPRFSAAGPEEAPLAAMPPPEDPLALAWAEGFAEGVARTRAEASASAAAEAAARDRLVLSMTRLDAKLEEELRLRLRDTVAALCESALAPLALDEVALMRRVEKAASMLARADDHRVVRLHPQDLALVAPRLGAGWQILPDDSLERGSLRVESESGGVEDGPEQWRSLIAEALHQC